MKPNRPQPWTVKDLVQLKRDGFLNVDEEYQRGPVWKDPQKKRLIDSVLRGYPLPMIYLLKVEKTVRGQVIPRYDIIDGQQRINALHEFHENKWDLFDPRADAKVARFPKFIEQQTCDWARKRFEALTPELQNYFLETEMAVVEIETGDSNEARDLFVRLQAGLPLTAQEKRDAWPGHLPLYIARIAGRHTVQGHAFFSIVKRSGGLRKSAMVVPGCPPTIADR